MQNYFQKQINFLTIIRCLLSSLVFFLPDLPQELKEIDDKYSYQFNFDENVFQDWAMAALTLVLAFNLFILTPILFWKNKQVAIYSVLFVNIVGLFPIYGWFTISWEYAESAWQILNSIDGIICCLIFLDNKYTFTPKN